MKIYNTDLWVWIVLLIAIIFLSYTVVLWIKDNQKKKVKQDKPKILAEDEPVIYDLGKTEEIKEEKEDGK
jgi:predicted membrane protein